VKKKPEPIKLEITPREFFQHLNRSHETAQEVFKLLGLEIPESAKKDMERLAESLKSLKEKK